MKHIICEETKRELLLPSIIAGLLWIMKCIYVAVIPIRSLALSTWLIDDSFIFMRVARNIALGNGYSFDGVTPTTGVPPLWALLTSLNHIFFGPELAAKLTVMESSLFGAASLVIVFYVAYKIFNSKVGWMAFALSVLSTPIFFNNMNGMETSLFTFLGLVVISIYCTDREKLESGRINTWYFSIGLLLGLMTLTRADSIFFIFAIVSIEVVNILKTNSDERKKCVTRIIALLVGVALLVTPLILWFFEVNGSPFPANQVGRRFLALGSVSLPDGSIIWSAYIKKIFKNIVYMGKLLDIRTGSSLVAFLAVFFGLFRKRGNLLAKLLAIYAATYLGTLVGYQFYFPDVHGIRYLSLTAHIVNVLVAAFCYQLFTGITLVKEPCLFKVDIANMENGEVKAIIKNDKRSYILIMLILGILTFSLSIGGTTKYRKMINSLSWTKNLRFLPRTHSVHTKEYWSMIDWIRNNLPKDTVIASKDHGQLALFSNARIIDLAGIISPVVIKHLKEGTLPAYFHDNKVEYVVMPKESKHSIHKAIRMAFGLERVAGSPQRRGELLYRVIYR